MTQPKSALSHPAAPDSLSALRAAPRLESRAVEGSELPAQPTYTPEPWTLETVRTSVGVCFKVGPFPWKRGKINHACIYADYPTPSNPEYVECLANAKLIAAAPDLLAALKSFVAEFGDKTNSATVNAARAAIERATS